MPKTKSKPPVVKRVVLPVELNDEPPVKGKRAKGERQMETKVIPIEYPDHMKDHQSQVEAEWRPFQVLNPDMLTESRNPKDWPTIKDPQTGKETRARISQIRWLERGQVMEGGQLVECIRRRQPMSGRQFKESFRRASTFFGKEARNLKESHRRAYERFKEDGYFDFDGGFNPGPTGWPGASGLPTGTFVAFPPGPLTRQLYLQDMWEQQSRAFQMYNHYDVIHGAIEMISAFVIGDGVRITSNGNNSDEAQDVWDEFEARTKFQPNLPEECMMLSVNGELMWHSPEMLVGGRPGYLDFVSKDPGTCWEIITQPDDLRKIFGYYFNYPTRYMIITEDDIPTTEYIVEMLPPQEMLHIKINVQANEARGRSDIFSVLSDAKMLQDLMRYRIIKVMNSSAIILEHTITGDDYDVNNIRNAKTGAGWLGAGTEIYHNESEKLEVLKGADSENAKSGLHDEVVGQVGNGLQLPADYMGSGGSGSRASALTRTEPAAKTFRKRQKKMEYPIRDLYRRVIQTAKKYGRIPMDTSEECEVTFPEIAPENTKEKLANIALAEQEEWITHEMAVNMAQKELDITNPPDYDKLVQLIQQYKTQQAKNDPTLSALMQRPEVNPDTGAVMPAQPGQGAAPAAGAKPAAKKPIAPSAGAASANVQGKNNSKNAYAGDKMGLSNKSRGAIKSSLQSKRDAHPLLGREAKTTAKGPKGEKKAHKAIHHGLRSRTKDTIQTLAEEAMGVSSQGALLRTSEKTCDDKAMLHENLLMKRAGFQSVLGDEEMETAPPGWEPTVKKMKGHPEIDNPFALAWWMSTNGYTPGGSKK